MTAGIPHTPDINIKTKKAKGHFDIEASPIGAFFTSDVIMTDRQGIFRLTGTHIHSNENTRVTVYIGNEPGSVEGEIVSDDVPPWGFYDIDTTSYQASRGKVKSTYIPNQQHVTLEFSFFINIKGQEHEVKGEANIQYFDEL